MGSLHATLINRPTQSYSVPLETKTLSRRASDFQMCVFAANCINRKFLIDAVPGMSPYIPFGFILSRTC